MWLHKGCKVAFSSSAQVRTDRKNAALLPHRLRSELKKDKNAAQMERRVCTRVESTPKAVWLMSHFSGCLPLYLRFFGFHSAFKTDNIRRQDAHAVVVVPVKKVHVMRCLSAFGHAGMLLMYHSLDTGNLGSFVFCSFVQFVKVEAPSNG